MKRGTLIMIISAVIFLAVFIFLIFRIATITGLVVTSVSTCQDTDMGKDYVVKGSVSGLYYLFSEERFYEEDYCEDDVVVEFYCVEEGLHSFRESTRYKCQAGCVAGECVDEQADEFPLKLSFSEKVGRFFSKVF